MGTITYGMKFDLKTKGTLPEIEAVEMELINSLSDSRGTIRDMCSHILNAGGKRIRPMLVIYSGMLFSDKKEQLIKAAVAAELIHMASLVHDDIIDCSSLRRNKPSVNSNWGNYFAVLGGDYLFAKAFGILSSNRLDGSMNYMVDAIQNMCHGEILQAEDRFNADTSLERYYEKIEMKTAVFLKSCCQSGAFISGANEAQIHLMGEYGLNLGFAFQIMDDILDFKGCADVMGKPKNEDLKQGNITLPIVLLLRHELYGNRIKGIIESKCIDDDSLQEICAVLNGTDILNRCLKTVLLHIDKARECLNSIPDSMYRKFLYSLADLMGSRVK